MPKCPSITINLTRLSNDRFAIIMACLHALKDNNLGYELEALSDDLHRGCGNIHTVIKKWFNVE